MNIELARFLKEISENAGNDCDIREDYSGRGMMGKTTAGIVVESVTLLLSDVLTYFQEQMSDWDEGGANNHTVYNGMNIPEIVSLRIDNMGRQVILY